jgi:hypothetical protein
MKKAILFIKNKIIILGAVMLATVVGGTTTAIVMAAIPDGDGIIHACRLNLTGVIRIIDSASQSCTGLETATNWSQGGESGGVTMRDANEQILGNLFTTPIDSTSPFKVYNKTLNRFIDIFYNPTAGAYRVGFTADHAFYQSNDCSGQAYAYNNPSIGAKTNLYRIGTSAHAIVQDSAQPQSITVSSFKQYDPSEDTTSCQDVDSYSDSFLTLSTVSLPFNMPIAGPFQF